MLLENRDHLTLGEAAFAPCRLLSSVGSTPGLTGPALEPSEVRPPKQTRNAASMIAWGFFRERGEHTHRDFKMSIAIVIEVHDGLVLAADSASSLMVSSAPNVVGIANVYDNANKIFNLYKGRPLGCIAYGAGSIGNSSIATLIKDLRTLLTDRKVAKEVCNFDSDQYTMEQVASTVASFLGDACQKQPPEAQIGMNIGLFVAGYSTGASLGEAWLVDIQGGTPKKPTLLRPPDQPGINWGGAGEVLNRIVLGFSPQLFQPLAQVSAFGEGQPANPAQLAEQLTPLLIGKLQAPLAFAPMPIKDAIDLAEFLVHAAIMFSRFSPGAQIVGGPIEIATITKHEGFKWIKRKHYYDQSLNRDPVQIKEPIHVVSD